MQCIWQTRLHIREKVTCGILLCLTLHDCYVIMYFDISLDQFQNLNNIKPHPQSRLTITFQDNVFFYSVNLTAYN